MASTVYETDNCFAGTHLYNWVEIGTVTVKCLAHEHNTMSSARGPLLESPGNFSGPQSHDNLYLKTEICIRLKLLV